MADDDKKIVQKIRLTDEIFLVRNIKLKTSVEEEFFANDFIGKIHSLLKRQNEPAFKQTRRRNAPKRSNEEIISLINRYDIIKIKNISKDEKAIELGCEDWDAITKKIYYLRNKYKHLFIKSGEKNIKGRSK